jgi:hypothetical protein
MVLKLRCYLSVSEGEITYWWCSSSSSSSIPLFFLPQETGTGDSWKAGTHFTTEVSDKMAVLVMTAVLVLVVMLVVVLVDVLVDKLMVVKVLVVVVAMKLVFPKLLARNRPF